ncbi:hypothetical protein PENTCL1PPCAC_5493, partial [Pristionchus entomophagus]
SALDIFDYCQTIAISAGLAVTIPLACIVYFKLLFSFQFSKNYTFKLIVCNGIAIPRTISNVIRIFVSFATLMANLYLFALITRERKFIDSNDRRKFNGEKGLVITSVVSYSFYMLYFVNNLISRYFAVRFCGYAQWMFVGLASMTPFWCLLLFSPSVRRLLIIRMQDVSATTVQSVTPTA